MAKEPPEPHEETVLGLPPPRPVPAAAPALATAETVELLRDPPAVDFDDEEQTRIASRVDMTGTVLADRYRLNRRIGEGGMGLVYEATHLAIDKRIAVKILSPEMCQHPEHVERFLREARTTSKIDHDNIVEIIDCGPTPHGSIFIAMEYLEGEDLSAMIQREGPQSWPRTRHFVLQLCDALAAAHARGVVHRDIKPQNCFRTTRRGERDFLKILDFGIAKLLVEDQVATSHLTRTGQVFGTPDYMSPEQIRGESADPRMDIYAVGVLMYELLVGRPPYGGASPLEIVSRHLRDPIPEMSPHRRGLEAAKQIDAVIQGAMAKDPAARFQTAQELAAAIRGIDLVGGTMPAPDSAAAAMARSVARPVRVNRAHPNRASLVVGAVALIAVLIAALAFAIG